MAFNPREPKVDENRPDAVGVSTPPGESVIDQVQDPNKGETVNTEDSITVDRTATAVEFLDPQPEEKEVEDTTVIFVPHKDFDARVNREVFLFRKDVPTRVTRDVANMLLEDRERGYVK